MTFEMNQDEYVVFAHGETKWIDDKCEWVESHHVLDWKNPTRELRSGGATEEGYNHTQVKYYVYKHMDGDYYLYMETHTQSLDCDGRMDTHDKQRAKLTRFDNEMWVKHEDTLFDPVSSGQRDYSAEAMGY